MSDARGRLVSELRQKGELLYLYGDSGHTHAVTAVSDGWRYEYDPNGNLARKVSQPWLLLDLYLPVVMSSLPEETLDSPSEPPESQSAPVSPYPLPEEQSRGQASGLVAWLHSAWNALVNWLGGGTQTAQAAGLLQAYPPPGDPTPTATATLDPTPTSTPTPTATPDPLEEIVYTYDAENRLVSVSSGEVQASFMYDGDGQRVASLINGAATVYIGEVFEWEVASGSMRRYYYAGAQRVAMRLENASPVWLLGDHLGSTSVAANTDGSLLSRQGYLPWGELRFIEGGLPGRYQFTGQASYEAEFGLYYFKARWYDPHLGRFSQPDSIVPQASQGVQAWDRYAYVNNSPLNATDPTGYLACWDQNADDPGCEQYDITYSSPTVVFSFDTKAIAGEVFPFTPEELRYAATQINHFALSVDLFAEGLVLGYVVVGIAGATTFEGNPVSGIPFGAYAGWILGNTNPMVQTFVTVGNISAGFASASSIIADIKTGESRLQFQVSQSDNYVIIDGNVAVSSNTLASGYLTTLGFVTRIVEGSLIIQGTTVAFDHGIVPTHIFSIPFSIQLPHW